MMTRSYAKAFFEYTMEIWVSSDGSDLLGVGGVIVW